MRIHIIRHGDPDYENDALTELGKREAIALAAYYKHGDLDEIYTSPLGRARDTAAYTAEKLHIAPVILPWLAEWGVPVMHTRADGGQERRALWNLPPDVLRQASQTSLRTDEEHPFVPQPQVKELMQSVQDGWHGWLKTYGIHAKEGQLYAENPECIKDKNIAFFCHHGFALAFLSLALHIPAPMLWASLWLPPTSVSTMLIEEHEDDKLFCRMIGMGDTSHLATCPENKSGSGLLYNTK